MGCDIHLHIEIRVNSQWYHYNHPNIRRNYALFAKMAGVRGDERPIAMLRGLPDDVTFTTKFDCEHWGPYGHSHSWLSSGEVGMLGVWYDAMIADTEQSRIFGLSDRVGYLFGNSYKHFHKYREDFPSEVEDFRFVFWFDN